MIEALVKAYTARAQVFHRVLEARQVDLLLTEIDSTDPRSLRWDIEGLGISRRAFAKVKMVEALQHQVLAHPDLISRRPHLVAYYRNLATVSKKGLGQILFSTYSFESGRRTEMMHEQALRLSKTLNQIISSVIEEIPKYRIELARQALIAEIGAELQGTWANTVGQGAAKTVEDMFEMYVRGNGIGNRIKKGYFELKNGWTIRFGSEPDVSFIDDVGVTQIAIEIKGSRDTAGAQTRYGEAKKSFGKALKQNPRCHTIYLASCFTDAVIEQIKADGQVRDWRNLTSIIGDEDERRQFLDSVFHIVKAPTKRRRG